MSNVYVLEPPTLGKVLLKTTVGDIDIELWGKETPKACRNFIQLCLEGYYDNTIFHRVVKGFIVQGGDPNGDGTGGESIYGETFKDEFHQRLKFSHRGIVAMANAGKDDNGSQFFFTMSATPELQNVHTIFGKVTGNTIYNMLKLEEGLIEHERPVYPHKIIKAEVLNNPFPDIEPRIREVEVKVKKKKEKTPGVKNFKLLSFGEEAEEDEEETSKINEKFSGKGKSSHDVLADPKLLPMTEEITQSEDKEEEEESPDTDPEERLENIRKKLRREKPKPKKLPPPRKLSIDEDDEDEEEDERKKKYAEIKKEIENVKREYHKNKLKKDTVKTEEEKKEATKNETLEEYKTDFFKYKDKKKSLPKKGAAREEFTLNLLDKFKKKLTAIKEQPSSSEETADPTKVNEDDAWMTHNLHFKDDDLVLARDANMKQDDWYEIYDPRNPLNKRRRGETTSKSSGNK